MQRFTLGLAMFLSAFVGAALCAPAPFRKKDKPFDITKASVALWGAFNKAPVKFVRGGGYECNWYSQRYVGTWRREGDVLYITESTDPRDPESWRTYTIDLKPCGREGLFRGTGASFKLE